MKNALVIGASGGIGQAICEVLERDGVAVTPVSRSVDGLDVTDPASVDEVLGALDGPFDLIFVAIGILGSPEKALSAVTADELMQVFAVNAVGPALVMRHVPRLLKKDSPAVCAVLSARVGSIGDNQIGGWYSYRASKAALNQIVHGAAIEIGRTHKLSVIAALHPGTVETAFTANYQGRHKTVPASEAARDLVNVVRDLGPEQSGGFFAYDGSVIAW